MDLLEDLNFDENHIIKDTAARNEKFDIHRIQSKNEASGPYNQDFDKFIVVIKGEAMLNVEGKDVRLKEMDTYFILKNVVHEIKSTSDEYVWLCFAIKQLTIKSGEYIIIWYVKGVISFYVIQKAADGWVCDVSKFPVRRQSLFGSDVQVAKYCK